MMLLWVCVMGVMMVDFDDLFCLNEFDDAFLWAFVVVFIEDLLLEGLIERAAALIEVVDMDVGFVVGGDVFGL